MQDETQVISELFDVPPEIFQEVGHKLAESTKYTKSYAEGVAWVEQYYTDRGLMSIGISKTIAYVLGGLITFNQLKQMGAESRAKRTPPHYN